MKGAVEVSMCISYTPDPTRNNEKMEDLELMFYISTISVLLRFGL